MRTHQSTPSRQQFVRICECGCEQPTLLAVQTHRRSGHVRGQPTRFIKGHMPRGADHPNWHGGIYHHAGGYLARHVPDHPAADAYGYVLEHRLVLEATLGRYLRSDEICHHRDGDKTNNRPENLELTDRAAHARMHQVRSRWAIHHDACRDCGTTERKHHANGRCQPCQNAWYRLNHPRRELMSKPRMN